MTQVLPNPLEGFTIQNLTKMYKNFKSMVAERAQRAATEENMQIGKTPANKENIFISLTTHVLQKFITHPNTETWCRSSQHKQIQKRAANVHNTSKYRNALQKLTTQPNTETCCKSSQHNQIQKRAAKVHNTTKYRNALQKLTTQPNTETRCKS